MINRHFFPLMFSVALCLGLSLGLAGMAHAQAPEDGTAQKEPQAPSATPGVEVDMDALESLSPSREKKEEKAPAPEADAPELNLPPSQPTEGSPPPLERPASAADEDDRPAAQSPEAPMMREGQSLPSGESDLAGSQVTVLFDAGAARLSLDASRVLDEAAASAAGQPVRLQLFAYAGEKGGSPSTTRRLALERAIAIRGYLMDQGIDGTRIDLRPQGPVADNEGVSGPPERVDIKFIQQ